MAGYNAHDLRIGPGSWWWNCRLFWVTPFRRLPRIKLNDSWYDVWEATHSKRRRNA